MHQYIVDHFELNDRIIHGLVIQFREDLAEIQKPNPEAYLRELCESIVSQQLSVKAASTIWGRTHSVVSDWTNPNCILSVDDDTLRSIGLSYQKIGYVKNIALAVQENTLPMLNLDTLPDEGVIQTLTQVKGIGRWTAEMFLIFTLGRNDVFSPGDLGLRNAIDRLYGTHKISPGEAQALAEKWSPYRSIASRVLWKSLDTIPA
jgi:DNA-3-methyladenine glycosylase II